MSIYDETKHRRGGHADNTGKYSDKEQTAADLSLYGPKQTHPDETFTARPRRDRGVYSVDNDQTDPPPIVEDHDVYLARTVYVNFGAVPHVNALQRAIDSTVYGDTARTITELWADTVNTGDKVTVMSIKNGHAQIAEGTATTYMGRPLLMEKGSRTAG